MVKYQSIMVKTELPPVTTQIRPLQSEAQSFVKNPFETLTPREKDVIALIAQGLSNKKIGTTLFIEPRTVEHHINNIYEKLNINDNNPERTARVDATNKYIDQNPDFKNPFDGHQLYESFTPREDEVLALAGQGLSNKAIAKKLSINTERTVIEHVSNILKKIGYDREKQNPRIVMSLASRAKLKIP